MTTANPNNLTNPKESPKKNPKENSKENLIEPELTESTDYACTWTKYWDWVVHDQEGRDAAYWETSCGGASTADNGVLTEDFRYCHICGDSIREVTKEYERERYEEEEDPDDARMEVIRREWDNVGR